MRTNRAVLRIGVLLAGALFCTNAPAQGTRGPASSPLAPDPAGELPLIVTGRGAGHRVWRKTLPEPGPSGQPCPRIHSFVELATGLHYRNAAGEWEESVEAFELMPGKAIARRGQHKVSLNYSLNSAGAVELETPEGRTLRSHVLGLSYFDGSTGESVLIAEIKDCAGKVAGNQVIYEDAFADFQADVRYTYTKAGFEQDIILREQPPAPEAYGLNPATTRLQVLTEFVAPPPPLRRPAAIVSRGVALPDEFLSFGRMRIGRGQAFALGSKAASGRRTGKGWIPVGKQWLEVDGRQVLVEEATVPSLQSEMDRLPKAARAQVRPEANSVRHTVSARRLLPAIKLAKATGKTMELARRDDAGPGLVLDYVTFNTDTNDFIFQGDTTYYVSGECHLGGVTRIEGGTVIKLDANGAIVIDEGGSIVCQTAAYRPAVFTSVNDDSAGQRLEGISSGAPAFEDVGNFLTLNVAPVTLHDLRFSYCVGAIGHYPANAMLDLWNCQFQEVNCALWGVNAGLHNVLIARSPASGIDAALWLCGSRFTGEQITADQGSSLFYWDTTGAVTVALTNCLITGQELRDSGGARPTLLTNAVAWLPTPAGSIYEPVGDGSHYLAANSPYRNAGTTNLHPDLLAALAQKTTHPPVLYSNLIISAAINLSPQVQRDTALPDLGYHYDPLDYIFSGVTANATVTLLPGTAAGWFVTAAAPWGLTVTNPSIGRLCFNGTASAPACWVRCSTVQEGGAGQDAGGGNGGIYVNTGSVNLRSPAISGRFGRFSVLGAEVQFAGNPITAVTNCEFFGGTVSSALGCQNMFNCLFERTTLAYFNAARPANVFALRNCTLLGGGLILSGGNNSSWTITDTAFDRTSIVLTGTALKRTLNYNAYLVNQLRLTPPGANDVVTTNFNWQVGPPGKCYLPTNSPLINAGSAANAGLAGLYHFTTTTNQAKEAGSRLDIGYHRAALDGGGQPLDWDGDTVPDYLEDANGNSAVDAGETAWQSYNSPHGLSGGDGLQVFKPLR